ncbi:MAG: AMP-binding protein [Micropruina sp.]|nr:AMP-binding protein [Micropruina sp.]
MDQLNLAVRFADTVARHGRLTATRIDSPNGWVTRTYAELGADVRRLAARLTSWGVQPGDRVLLFALNRPEWSLIDFACLTVRAVSVPIYTSSTPIRCSSWPPMRA